MNLLITGAWGQARETMPQIENMGHPIIFMQQERDELPCAPEWVEGVICNGLFLYHAIEKFINLRYIQLTSIGYDRVPMDYIKEHGIVIHNARDAYSIPMAEHAVACALWFYRDFGVFYDNQKAHTWEKRRNLRELNKKTVLIIGCGNVGTACARAFKGLGCRVDGISKHGRASEVFTKICCPDEMKACLSNADIVIVSVPLSEETKRLIAEDELSAMKDGALLINISRGEVIDTDALIKHLPRLGGAALDVFEEEPLKKDHPLWDCRNVLITPHNSFVGDGNADRLKKTILDYLNDYDKEKSITGSDSTKPYWTIP